MPHHEKPLGKKQFHRLLKPMQVELVAMHTWLRHTGKRLVVLFEGRDAAGKGGVISALAKVLDPRHVRVVALPSPSERERSQWYFQRYVAHLPAAGEIVLFDRSWYNRAGVEQVMGFCSESECAAFLEQAPVFEKLLTDDGILLFKYWLSVDQQQQEQRFVERLADPVKRWKLSPIDLAARAKYAEYGEARERMFRATHMPNAPWTVVDFNDQRLGRLNLLRDLLDRLPDCTLPEPSLELPELPTAQPQREQFTGVVQPLPNRFAST